MSKQQNNQIRAGDTHTHTHLLFHILTLTHVNAHTVSLSHFFFFFLESRHRVLSKLLRCFNGIVRLLRKILHLVTHSREMLSNRHIVRYIEDAKRATQLLVPLLPSFGLLRSIGCNIVSMCLFSVQFLAWTMHSR